MAGVPAYITPLSYIRGSGTQYITTGIHLRSTDVVKSKWQFEGASGNVYGCYTSGSADDNFCLYAGSASANAYIRYNGQLVRAFRPSSGTIHELEQGADGFYDNGGLVTSFNAATFECSAPMYIFMLPHSSSAKVTARCYGLTVYRDGEQACNFIPARNELTGEVGFYESVGGVFYENAGTGVFTAGPEVNFSVKTLLLKRRRALMGIIPTTPPYDAEVEYLDSNGCYLDTHFPAGDHRIEAEFRLANGYVNNKSLFGIWTSNEASALFVTLYQNSYYFGTGPNTERNVSPATPFDKLWHTYTLSARGLFQVDQDVLYNTPNTIGDISTTYFLFARHSINSSGAENPSQYTIAPEGFRCKSFKIYDNVTDELIFDGIPVRKGNVGYIYDRVGHRLLGCSGGGNFGVGPDVANEDTPGGAYIREGLVMHLDGIDAGSLNGSQWVDLVNSHVFTNHGATKGSDCFIFANGGADYLDNTTFISPNTNVGTIEVAYDLDFSQYAYIFCPDAAKRIGLMHVNRLFMGYGVNSTYTGEASKGTISVDDTTAYMNGSPLTKAANGNLVLTHSKNTIGNELESGRGLIGKVYSIRIYDRKLTYAEMQHNLAVDNARFNLGLTL